MHPPVYPLIQLLNLQKEKDMKKKDKVRITEHSSCWFNEIGEITDITETSDTVFVDVKIRDNIIVFEDSEIELKR